MSLPHETDLTETSTEPKRDRISVSLTGDALAFIEDFENNHADNKYSDVKVVKLGLMLLKLTEELGPDETLAILDRETGINRPVVLPWREDTSRVQLPSL